MLTPPMKNLRKAGLILVILAPITFISPVLYIPILNSPLIGSLSDNPAMTSLIGLVLWTTGCLLLIIRRVRLDGVWSLLTSLKIFAGLCALIIFGTVSDLIFAKQSTGVNDALGLELVPVYAALVIVGIWMTVQLAKKS